jgi:hypothetical protein
LHDGSPLFVKEIFSQSRFQDVCTTSGKWFREKGKLFRPLASDETIGGKIPII